jgi:hypothetical protein
VGWGWGHRGEILHNGMGGVWGERGDRWGDLYGVELPVVRSPPPAGPYEEIRAMTGTPGMGLGNAKQVWAGDM